MPGRATGKVASLRQPLVFDPGTRWLYGINIEWTGRLIETVSGVALEDYFRERIFEPLGMKDSGYVTSQEQRARQARLHTRQPGPVVNDLPMKSLTSSVGSVTSLPSPAIQSVRLTADCRRECVPIRSESLM